MAKKNNEIKENDELEKEAIQETTTEIPEKVEEIKENKKEEIVVSEEKKQDAEVKVIEKENLTVKEVFKDKYDSIIVYNVGDVFIKDEALQDNKTIKAEKGKYKVSKERYEELKRSLYVD